MCNFDGCMLMYRVPQRADLRDIAELNRELLAQRGHENLFSTDELILRLSDFLSTGHDILMFEQDKALVGYVLYLVGKHEIAEKIVYVRHFVIRSSYRRKGFGRKAMMYLLDSAWPRDATPCVDVHETNGAALAFWRALGFRPYSYTLTRTEVTATSDGK